jgi:hypothetical protein
MVHYRLLPVSLQEGMRRYIEFGVRPGSFLNSCLENNLASAISRADDDNLRGISRVVNFLLYEAPAGSWGSEAAVQYWVDAAAERERQLREAPAVNV